jgi:DNA polymerase III delta prime subunit
MASRQVEIPTLKRLFAESRGHCAKCDLDLFPDGKIIGEICHIEAYSSGGPRYNGQLKKNNLENHYDNLIVLCPSCHTEIDKKGNEIAFKKERLIEYKINHLSKIFNTSETVIDKTQIEQVLNRFEQSIQSELLDIKDILSEIIGNRCFRLIKERFKSESDYISSFANINSYYFSNKDVTIIENIKKGTEIEYPQSYILVGPPSSGKTTLILKLTNELSDSFTHFYINLGQSFSPESIWNDLKYLKKFNAFIYVDDCHLNNNLACDIYNMCSESPNLTLIFIYREILDEFKVSDNYGLNLFKSVSNVYNIDSFSNQNEKIKVLIENKRNKILEHTGKNPLIGNIETVYGFIDKNLLKLSLLLQEWEKQPSSKLDSIDNASLNRLLYKRFLNTKYQSNEIEWLKTYASINKYEIPFRIFDETNLKGQLLKDALVKKIETEYTFFHSSFANLILLSILSKDDNFDLKYPGGLKSFEEYSVKKYLVDLANINVYKYTDNIVYLLRSILVNKNFDLYKFLIRNNDIKNLIVQYFKYTDNYEVFSLFFKDLATSCSNKYHTYYTEIIDNSRLQKMLGKQPVTILELKILFFILKDKSYTDFKRSIKSISKDKLKSMVLSSKLSDITYTTRHICEFDKEFAEYLIENVSIEEWVSLYNNGSVFSISNSTIELLQIKNKAYVRSILLKIDIEAIVENSNRDPIDGLTQAIQSLNKVNEVVSKKIADSLSEHFIIQKIYNQPLDKISKCFQELYLYKENELNQIVNQFVDRDIIKEFSDYSLVKIGKTISELSDINEDKISNLVVNRNFQLLLLEKLSEETTVGNIGKIIADLRKANSDSANSFVANLSPEILKDLIPNSTIEQLSTFIYNLYSVPNYKDKAIALYLSVPSKSFASKTFDKKFRISNYETCISTLSKVDRPKTNEFFTSIPDDILLDKCIGVGPRKVLQTLKNLYLPYQTKIKNLSNEVIKDKRFQNELDNLNITDLIHSFSFYLNVDEDNAISEFSSKIENITLDELEGVDISAFSDGIKLINDKLEFSRNTPLIKIFELYLIKSYPQFRCNQISITFINLRFIDKQYAYELLDKTSVEILAKKAIEIDGTNKLNGFLGEIRIVNPEYHLKLTTEIEKRRKNN